MMATFSYKRSYFSVIVKISVKTLWRHAIHAIFAFLSNHNGFSFSFDMISIL